MENGLTHFDKEGNAVMVDVSGKNVTYRTALATGYIAVGPEIMACVTEGNVKKGDVLGVARVAAFYCINVYNDTARYYRNLITLAVMSAAFVMASFLLIRRNRYDSI